MYKYFIYLMIIVFTPTEMFSAEKHEEQLKYFTPLSSNEQHSIHYIVTMLGTKSALTLLIHREDLNRAGSQVLTVHPLRFWKEIFTHPHLKNYSKKIGYIPKKHMTSDFIKSFEWVSSRGLFFEDQISDFSLAAGLNKEVVSSLIKNAQWNRLLDLLFQRVQL